MESATFLLTAAPLSLPVTSVVHISRKAGVIVQGCDIYIGRSCNMGGWALPESKWRNPYTVRQYGGSCILLYIKHLYDTELVLQTLELQGKVLGCWCKPKRSHGDVLKYIVDNIT